MAATAEERIPVLKSSEDIFSLAVPFVACSENRIGANAPEGKKPHQGIFPRNRTIAVGATSAKWPETHQVSGQSWSETVLGIVIDANGNTLSDASGKSYSWDFENRLTQAVVPGTNGGTTTFKYDPFGRRIQKSGPLGTTNYLYDGPDVIEEVDNSGNVSARNTKGPGIDETLATLRSGTTSYYQADGLGSVTSLSNGAGALANTYTYDSYGRLSASSGTLVNPFQYAGREFDSETGLYYYRNRYYDSSTGRFLSEDPLEFEGGDVDLYRYVSNGPVRYIDPDGLGQLPANPSGLGPQWTRDPTHRDPNGERWRNPDGDYLDFHRGRPGKPKWGGRDHWHFDGCPDHLAPGDAVPVDTAPVPNPQPQQPKAPDNTPETPSEPSSGPNPQVQKAIQETGFWGTVLLIIYYAASAMN
jgi:RHS repeat-associated protein